MMSLFWEEFNFPFSFGPVVTGPVFGEPFLNCPLKFAFISTMYDFKRNIILTSLKFNLLIYSAVAEKKSEK